jgi:hypothetical protein
MPRDPQLLATSLLADSVPVKPIGVTQRWCTAHVRVVLSSLDKRIQQAHDGDIYSSTMESRLVRAPLAARGNREWRSGL